MASYYAETVAEEDQTHPVILEVPLSEFDPSALEPDGNSIAEPLTHTLRSTDDALYRRWQKSDGSWKASLRIYGSVVYRGATIRVAAHQVTRIEREKKQRPIKAVEDNYRRMLRLLSWGKQLSQQDQETKAYIEQKYDISDIKI